MDQILRIGIPVYFILYFGIAFVAKSLIIAKRTGKNPIAFPSDDSAHGLIGLYLKFTVLKRRFRLYLSNFL